MCIHISHRLFDEENVCISFVYNIYIYILIYPTFSMDIPLMLRFHHHPNDLFGGDFCFFCETVKAPGKTGWILQNA